MVQFEWHPKDDNCGLHSYILLDPHYRFRRYPVYPSTLQFINGGAEVGI